MEVIVTNEISVFFLCVAGGMATGCIYDLFRAMRRIKNFSQKAISVQDMTYWALATVTVYLTVYYSNGAKLRWNELSGLIFGFLIYFLLLSKLFLPVITKAEKFIFHIWIYFKRKSSPLLGYVKSFINGLTDLKSRLMFKVHKKSRTLGNKFRCIKNMGKKNCEKN